LILIFAESPAWREKLGEYADELRTNNISAEVTLVGMLAVRGPNVADV